jgi:hypothetical protein
LAPAHYSRQAVKKWVVTILLAVILLALALAMHFWGAYIIKFAVDERGSMVAFGSGLERDNPYNPHAFLAGSWADGKKQRNASRDEKPGTRNRSLELVCIDAQYNHWCEHLWATVFARRPPWKV